MRRCVVRLAALDGRRGLLCAQLLSFTGPRDKVGPRACDTGPVTHGRAAPMSPKNPSPRGAVKRGPSLIDDIERMLRASDGPLTVQEILAALKAKRKAPATKDPRGFESFLRHSSKARLMRGLSVF